jgi:hypothetical protein
MAIGLIAYFNFESTVWQDRIHSIYPNPGAFRVAVNSFQATAVYTLCGRYKYIIALITLQPFSEYDTRVRHFFRLPAANRLMRRLTVRIYRTDLYRNKRAAGFE